MFKHASNRKEGENLYMSSHKPAEPCTTATKAFYGEVKYYDFDKPGFSLKTGHFTQVTRVKMTLYLYLNKGFGK